MKVNRRRALAVALSMAGTAAAGQYAVPDRLLADIVGKPDLERLFPQAFGDWRVDTDLPILLPSADVQARLNAIYSQLLSRTYVNGQGRHVMLSAAYGGDQADGTRAHRPEICYPAQGFQVLADQAGRVALRGGGGLPLRRLYAVMGARHEPLSYWIVAGGVPVIYGSQQKLCELRYGLRGLVPDGLLVRVSSIGADVQGAYGLHDAFIRELWAAQADEQRWRLFGVDAGAPALLRAAPLPGLG